MRKALKVSLPSNTSMIVERPEISYPVPVVRPAVAGQIIALDVMPSAGAVEDANNGYAWIDVCDADLITNPNGPVTCARVGVKHDRVEFGSRNFGAPAKDVYIIRGTQVLAKFTANGLQVFGTVTATGFVTA